jgi:hypothetical protein
MGSMMRSLFSFVAAITMASGIGACAGSTDSGTPAPEADIAVAKTTKHDVFVCTSSDKSAAEGVYMFAHDPKGATSGAPKAGYCEITVDAQGKAFGSYFCFVEHTDTDKTTDGQLAIMFTNFLGDGAKLIHQINLPADLLEKKGGQGKMRLLSRAPQDLRTPVKSGDSVEDIDCKEQSVEFSK